MRLVCSALFVVLLPAIAAAQNRGIFVQGGPLLDVLLDSSLSASPGVSSSLTIGLGGGSLVGQPSDEQTHSTRERLAPGGSFALGVFVSPSVSLRVETSFQGNHVSTEESSSVSEGTSSSTRDTSSTTDISIAAGWHQGDGRVSLTYLGGVVFRRQQNDILASFTYPSLVVRTVGGRLVQVLESETEETSYNATLYDTGVMAGLDVTVNLSNHVALVPQVRLVGSSYSWNVRPAVSMRWRP